MSRVSGLLIGSANTRRTRLIGCLLDGKRMQLSIVFLEKSKRTNYIVYSKCLHETLLDTHSEENKSYQS